MTPTPAEVEEVLTDVGACVDASATLPAQVFRGRATFRVIEWDILWSRKFFEAARYMTEASGSERLKLLVLSPDPVQYFLHQFGKLPLVTLNVKDDAGAYLHCIGEDPGDSPADAIVHNSDVVVVWPSSRQWCLYGDRNFEIALIALHDERSVRAVDSTSLPRFSMREAIERSIVRLRRDDEAIELLRNFSDDVHGAA
jgi:hypothetical protein